MLRQLTCIVVLAGGLICASPQIAAADLETPEQLLLDTYRAPNIGMAGPVSTVAALTDGRAYVVTVRGTFSAYQPTMWGPGRPPEWTVCGTPQGSPLTPSPGQPDAPTGQDAEVFFARPSLSPCQGPLPVAYGGFQVDTGNGYFHPSVSAGPFTAPRADHTYSYLVAGTGGPLRFRQVDSQTTDNTGVLEISVRPASQADCGAGCPGAVIPPAAGTSSSTSASTMATTNSASSLNLPSNRRCISRRKLTIHIVTRRRDPVRAATVRFNGKQVKVFRKTLRGKRRHAATLNFAGVRKATVSVQITARLRSGRVLKGKRVYKTCDRKLRGGRPKL